MKAASGTIPFQVLLVVVACLLGQTETAATRATTSARDRGVFRHLRAQAATQDSPVADEDDEPKKENDGTQQLPIVTAVLKDASVTLKSLGTEANVLKARLNQAQQQSSRKLSAQKTIYEKRLRMQVAGNEALISANGKILSDVNTLKKDNQVLRDAAGKLEESNRFKRKELHVLQSRLKDTRDFFEKAFRESDDSHASQLAVLGEESDKPSTEQSVSIFQRAKMENERSQEQDEDDDDDDDVASLLAVSSRVWRSDESLSAEAEAADALRTAEKDTTTPLVAKEVVLGDSATPEQVLSDLEAGVKSMEIQQKDGEAKLKAMFIEHFRAGHHQEMALKSRQKELNATKASLLSLQTRLQAAKDHLRRTETKLEGNMRDLGVFLRHFAQAALAPAEEASQALRGLPNSVEN
eukprot:TRINITY_DN51047_c0_g1_i1.p1 TRINITY_DN51047_c0_g1~~TRINITY_DN51047_c0_g1_i1.p1  ORF type:complete len:433 (-),score=114.45 TRINITY_DN51047_c0_g1_i1:130-1359(-)